MKKARATLDALMGPSRDVVAKDMSDDWKDRKVCKTFLVAACPYDKTMLGGRKGTEVCPKIHNEMLREAFNKSADVLPIALFEGIVRIRPCETSRQRLRPKT